MDINETLEMGKQLLNEEETWKDYFGKTIRVGDTVVISGNGFNGFGMGTILRANEHNPKYILVQVLQGDSTSFEDVAGETRCWDPKDTLLYN